MPTEFQFLTRDGRAASAVERSRTNTVEMRYSFKELAERPVIRDELNNKYIVFDSRREFLAWYEALPEKDRCCHEVIIGRLPQRLKFDIDAMADKLDAIPDTFMQEPNTTLADESVDELLADLIGDEVEISEEAYLEQILPKDSPPPKEDPHGRKICAIVNCLIEAVLDELYDAYHGLEAILPTREDLAVTESSGPTPRGQKYSYHVIVLPYYVADNEEAHEFTDRVIRRLPAAIRPVIDASVNKKIQNFRLPDSAKPGTGRFKRASPEAAREFGTASGLGPGDMLITAARGGRVLARAYTGEPSGKPARARPDLGRGDPAVAAALAVAAEATRGHELCDVRGTLLCFERVAPTRCELCRDVHHKDNSLMIGLSPGEGLAWNTAGPTDCLVIEYCRQRRGHFRVLGSIKAELSGRGITRPRDEDKTDRDRVAAASRVEGHVRAIQEGRVDPHSALASEFEQLPLTQKTVYAEGAMRDYELVPTLAVAAQMKLGKTKAMRRYLDTHFPANGLETKVIRFVTFRQTFSRAISEAFPDFALYTDIQGDIDRTRAPRLIIQVESLHRLRMETRAEPIDLLVLDEVESILSQFNSGLHKHFTAAFAMFQWMLRTARHVVCMDANLGDRAFRTLARMRPAHPAHFHWNRHQRAADDTYFFTADQGAWLDSLYNAVRAGQHIVLPTNSLTEARAYDEALRRQFPAKRIMLYSSETAPSEKARHFGDVHRYWGDLDVLIYTPTCSAGVSFELEHFDALYAYFCDGGCDVETCRQMLGRVRNLRTQELHICLRGRVAALPTTVEEIRRLVYDKRAGLYRGVDDAALQFAYTDEGEVLHHESDYFHLWLETVRMENLSRNDFTRRFIDQVADTGANLAILRAESAGPGAALLANHRETRVALRDAHCEAVAAAADLAAEEEQMVRDQLGAQVDISPAVLLAHEKYMLREAYSWHERALDARFVRDYQSADARRVYRNLQRIAAGRDVADSLRLMQKPEASNYSYLMETRHPEQAFINESRDLQRTCYAFQSHFLAIWLLRVCGFRCITDEALVHEFMLEYRLRESIPLMCKALSQIVFEFEIARPDLNRAARETSCASFIPYMLRTVNAVLRHQYGIQISREKRSTTYRLRRTGVGVLFVFSAAEADCPHIVSNLKPLRAIDSRVAVFLEEQWRARAGLPDPDEAMPAPNAARGLDAFLSEKFEEVVARHGDAY